MKTRATITIDPKLHARAKRLARQRRTSVSGLFESFLREQPEPGGSLVDEMIGKSRLKEASDQPDPRREALIAKYING
jgi:hypothetical protein